MFKKCGAAFQQHRARTAHKHQCSRLVLCFSDAHIRTEIRAKETNNKIIDQKLVSSSLDHK